MDLSKEYPASPNDTLAGIVLLKRMVDKTHAHIEGTLGDYEVDCPSEKPVLEFLGVDGTEFAAEVRGLQYDYDRIEDWAKPLVDKHTPAQITAFNESLRAAVPDALSQGDFDQLKAAVAPNRPDVKTWFQLFDLDEKRSPDRVPYNELPPILEIRRFASPTAGNNSLELDGDTLWVGSITTNELHSVDLGSESPTASFKLPGAIFGLATLRGSLRVMLGQGDDSFRTVYRFTPEGGLETEGTFALPDGGTGSHLAVDESNMFAAQRELRRFVLLDERGTVLRTIDAGARLYGLARAGTYLYAIATHSEHDSSNEFLLRVDIMGKEPEKILARFPFDAHGLVFDGQKFWTNDTAGQQIVAFAPAVEA